mmetsp:Transcript_31348/g.72730  ORF Transcript_31348/g.72730 Transcript_31348/m.72730 type:complete len:489 (+) Transcript_31348:2-1468(+)
MVDSHHHYLTQSLNLSQCQQFCQSDATCVGWQHHRPNSGSRSLIGFCRLRRALGPAYLSETNTTCADCFKFISFERGFSGTPLVPLTESDGTVYMREDCVAEQAYAKPVTYWDLPWSWAQRGTSLAKESGYGVSPLMPLVTPQVVNDVISGVPWRRQDADLRCHNETEDQLMIRRLRQPMSRSLGRAVIVDIGACICKMLGGGWDPARDLHTDVVFLLHKDVNFSPASPYTRVHWFAEEVTSRQCTKQGLNKGVFPDDMKAFTALANHEHTKSMYFTQTPPITHDKLFLIPLGVDRRFKEVVQGHLLPNSSARTQSRTALYEVSHNMAIDYRRNIFHTVEKNFAAERESLHYRHVPWALGSRMGDIIEETSESVFGQSPIGIGENCFRHTELLLVGAIPVVQGSLGVASLRYLPHVSVARWSDVTPALLRNEHQKVWEQVQEGAFTLEPLTFSFWRKHIWSMANGTGLEPRYAKFPNPEVTCLSWECL